MSLLEPRAAREATHYAIRLRGQLDQTWTEWFAGFSLTTNDDGTTTLAGEVVDQAALYGVLRRLADLGVTLLSVNVTTAAPKP